MASNDGNEFYEENFDRPKTVDEIKLEKIEELLFPHQEIRDIQDSLIKTVDVCVKNKKHLVAHAPTGLGKTAAALSPALTYAIKHESSVIFFLTSRHTQHKIVLDTLSKINKKFDLNIKSVSIIGKKHLCLQPNIDKFHGKDFAEYCKLLKEEDKCEFYSNLKNKDKLSVSTEKVLSDLNNISKVANTETIIIESSKRKVCPYEISILLARASKVIITDYQYMFNKNIRDNFFRKINRELKDSIIIVDEAHNLPSRVKDLSSEYLSNIMIKRAISEAKKFKNDEVARVLDEINVVLERLSKKLVPETASKYQKNFLQKNTNTTNCTLESFNNSKNSSEKDSFEGFTSELYIDKDEFIGLIDKIKNYDEIISEFEFFANIVREDQGMSYVGSVANFLNSWLGDDLGFTRIINSKKYRDGVMIILGYRCLDPSIITSPVINGSHSTILMSGTLTPTSMYKELLGIESIELTLKSPFPTNNRLNIVIPKTSTKFEVRTEEQYRNISEVLLNLTKIIPGCIAIYFPSYYLMDEVSKYFSTKTTKTVFSERPEMSKSEKHEFLEQFKTYKDKGAVLLAVITGNFAEGIDMPGILKGVVIVGLPLQKPDLETKALIQYYDEKFKKGWDYGYLFPAFTKTIQAAGRCIRTETDKGVIIFLDERYSWNNYSRCFPNSWNIKTTLLYEEQIKRFFEDHKE